MSSKFYMNLFFTCDRFCIKNKQTNKNHGEKRWGRRGNVWQWDIQARRQKEACHVLGKLKITGCEPSGLSSSNHLTGKLKNLDLLTMCKISAHFQLSVPYTLSQKKKKVIKINSFMWPCLPSPFTEQQNVHCPCNLYQKVWLHCLSIHSIMTGFTTPLIIAKELTSLLV